MRALVYDGASEFRTDYPKPEPLAHESLVRVVYATICNTDREVMRGYKPSFTGVLGHEFVGIVEASNDASLVGCAVVGELNESCGECLYCEIGRPHHCEHRKVIGMADKDGCFAEYMTIATSLLHRVPDGLPLEEAIFCEPLAAALEILEQVAVRPSWPVAVVGDGRLAFMVAQVLALTGASVTVFGRHQEKLQRFEGFARTTMEVEGAFELVAECSGNPSGLATGIQLTRSGGTLVMKSTYAGDVSLDMSEIVVRELQVVGSRCGPFEPALELLRQGRIVLPEIEWFGLEDYEAAFATRAMKVGFRLTENEKVLGV